jgi:alanine dehydrogenase
VVADISCDVGGPIDSTLRSSTITDPLYGYDRETASECAVGHAGSITVMAVDNLPCELPRDASASFGNELLTRVLPHLIGKKESGMIDRATIVRAGRLTEPYAHLSEYVEETG